MHRSDEGKKDFLENIPREEGKRLSSNGGAVSSGSLGGAGMVSNLLESREPDVSMALYSGFRSGLALPSDQRASRTPSSGPFTCCPCLNPASRCEGQGLSRGQGRPRLAKGKGEA